jgi:hypothetical protein
MASLTDVYDGHVRTVTTARRVSLGAGTFVVGTAMVVGSIVLATTAVGAEAGLTVSEARELAGILAGLGLPAAVLGVFAVLPAGRATRAASLIGASVCLLGVALFSAAYPTQWFGAGNPTLGVVSLLVYFTGAITAMGCLFAGLATFKTRDDPGGTAKMEITEEGSVRLVEDDTAIPGFGSVGLFGKGPDGDVATQTNRESPPRKTDRPDDGGAEVLSGRSAGASANGSGRGSAATADGGSATVEDSPAGGSGPPQNDAEFLDAADERGRPDAYCGNCAHFEYVKVDEKITPYCGLHDELMEDMDACDQWADSE